jgi:hypothetical protein
MFLIINFVFRFLYKFLFPLSRNQENEIFKAGFGSIEECERVLPNGIKYIDKIKRFPYLVIEKNYIKLGTENFQLTKDDVTSKLEVLSNILNLKLLQVTSIATINSQLVFTIAIDILDDIKVPNKSPKPFAVLAGINAELQSITIDFKTQTNIVMAGITGSGKTIYLINLIKQAFEAESLEVLPNPAPINLIVLDDKGINYKKVIKAYNGSYYDASDLVSLTTFNDRLIDILAMKNRVKKIMAEHSVEHTEDLRAIGIEPELSRHIILIDEAGVSLRASKKDEPREDFRKIKEQIINNLTICMSQLRAFSCEIIVSSQRAAADEMDIPYSNFSVRLFNGVEIEFSRKYCQSAVPNYKTLGKWWISSEHYSGWIKVPDYDPQMTFKNLPKKYRTDLNEYYLELEDLLVLLDPQNEIVKRNYSLDKLHKSELKILSEILKKHQLYDDLRAFNNYFDNRGDQSLDTSLLARNYTVKRATPNNPKYVGKVFCIIEFGQTHIYQGLFDLSLTDQEIIRLVFLKKKSA